MSTPNPGWQAVPSATGTPPVGAYLTSPVDPTFVPVASPRPRATRGQIAVAVLTSFLILITIFAMFVAGVLLATKNREISRAQLELSLAQQELEHAQETRK